MSNWKGGFDGKHYTVDEAEKYIGTLPNVSWAKLVVVHNTANPNIAKWKATPGGSVQRIKNLENFYKNDRKWSSGPHGFIPPEGGIFFGTPLTETGTHSPSWNSMSWGIELCGDYNVDDDESGDGLVIKKSAIRIVAALLNHQKLTVDDIRFHYEDPKTTHKGCPGKNLVKSEFEFYVGERLKVLDGTLIEPGNFTYSDFCRHWAKRFEGLRLKSYWDKNGYAIGYGHNNASGVPPAVDENTVITEEQALEILEADLALQARYINKLVKVPLTQGQVDALILHVFQQGPGNVRKGRVLERVNNREFDLAYQAIRDWPTINLGLLRRRSTEAEIFLGLKPDKW